MEPGETPSYSASHQAPNYVAKNDEIMSKINLQEPQRKNNATANFDQYCMSMQSKELKTQKHNIIMDNWVVLGLKVCWPVKDPDLITH